MRTLRDVATYLKTLMAPAKPYAYSQVALSAAPKQAPSRLEGPARLHVVAVYFNHNRFKNLKINFERFKTHMRNLGVTLYVVEVVLNGSDFEVSEANNPYHIQLRARYEMFRKENLCNIGFERAKLLHGDDAEYFAWIDADVHFVNDNIVEDTIAQLNRHAVVQMWSRALDIDPEGNPIVFKDTKDSVVKSFAWCSTEWGVNRKPQHGYSTLWHPGYAWAIRRDVYDKMGGLFDISILGAGDHHMAWAFVGHAHMGIHGGTTDNYKSKSLDWLYRIKHTVNGDLGCVKGTIFHYWHGRKSSRKYVERWSILVDNKFEPDHDLVRREDGLLELTERNPKLRDGIRAYFRQRNDDANTMD